MSWKRALRSGLIGTAFWTAGVAACGLGLLGLVALRAQDQPREEAIAQIDRIGKQARNTHWSLGWIWAIKQRHHINATDKRWGANQREARRIIARGILPK